MPVPPDPHEEFRSLDERRRSTGLSPAEEARWDELRASGADRPLAPAPADTGFDVAAAAEAFRSSLSPEPHHWEAPESRPTSVAWGVAGPPPPSPEVPEARPPEAAPPPPEPTALAEELPEVELASAADFLDQARAATDGEGPAVAPGPDDEVPEISESDIVEVLEATPAPAELPPLVPSIDSEPSSFLSAAAPPDDVVSLNELVLPSSTPVLPRPPAAPPPPGAQSLAGPLPPPPAVSSWAAPAGHTPPPDRYATPARTPPMTELLGDPRALDAATGEPPRGPAFVSGEHRVVVHTIEGQVVRGILAEADLEAREIPVVQPTGEVVRLPAAHLKAIFFMLAPGQSSPPAEGTRVRVVFGDGRQVAGLSPDFSPAAVGFFVVPVDVRSNTGRIWVFREAVRQVSVG